MLFAWIKKGLPRGLYGRAALILIVPIVTIQLVVSGAFLQRHFEDVTEQMTTGLAVELRFVLAELEEGGIEAGRVVATPLGIILREGSAQPFDGPQTTDRLFYDFSGRVVIITLMRYLDEITWIDLKTNDRVVVLNLGLSDGASVDVEFTRRRVSASNPHQLLVLMVFTGILMTGVAYLFLRNQLRPIRRLARAAEAFGKGRAQDYQPSGALEVRSAGRAFLDMRSRIEQQIEQRTMMLSGVSHDLRTPLTRMKLGLSFMEESEEVEGLKRDVEEMEGLLTGFLDFARSDALDDPEVVDVSALIEQVVADAQRGGGDVSLLGAPDQLEVELRPLALRRALQNLLSNALRYGDQARVSVSAMERAIRLTVEDNGPGIAPEDRADALRPFVRLDEARNQNKGLGVGLGLAIASDIARRHGGTLRLSDSAQMGGLRVDVVLPR